MNVLAGYLAATRVPRPGWVDDGVRAAELISMSDCVVDVASQHDARRAADCLTASKLGDPKVFLWVPVLLLSPAQSVPPGR